MSITKAKSLESGIQALRSGYSHISVTFSKYNGETKKLVELFTQELANNQTCRVLEIKKYLGPSMNLGQVLENNTYLRSLSLVENHLRSTDAKDVAEGLKNNTSLLSLNLWNNYLGDDGTSTIAKALTINKGLKNLRLGSNKIGNAGAKELGNALLANNTLEYIGLGSNGINDEGVTHLADALQQNTTLRNLCLGDNEVGDEGAEAIGTALTQNLSCSLIDLDLNWNRIGPVGAEAISNGLADNKTVEILNLRGNIIGPLGGIHIGNALGVNNVLTDLSLSGNGIGYEGAVAIGKNLKKNETLTTLHLQDNDIGDIIGSTAIGNSLTENRTLQSLNLRNNRVGNEAAKAIGEGLFVNKALTSLDLSFNSIENSGALSIAYGLNHNCSLASLNMASNAVDPRGARLMVQSLGQNFALKELETGHFVPAVKEFLIRNRGRTDKSKRTSDLTSPNNVDYLQLSSTPTKLPDDGYIGLNLEEEEWKRQTRIAIKRALKNGDTTHYRRAKLMLIGHQRHGKSSLVRSLTGEVFNPNENSTNVAHISDASASSCIESGVRSWKSKKIEGHVFIGEFQETAIRMAQEVINCMNSVNSNRNMNECNGFATFDCFDNNLVTEKREIETLKKIKMKKENSTGRVQKQPPKLNKPVNEETEVINHIMINDEEIVKKFGTDMVIDEKREDKPVSFTIWDFAGQEVFYTMHHVFLTRYGVYLLAFDMREALGNPEQAISNLKCWLNSVELHAPDAPVVLVGTFADYIEDENQLNIIDDLLAQELEIDHNPQICFNHESDLSFFPVDNTGSSGEEGVHAIRQKVERIIHRTDVEKFDFDKITEPVKLAWMYFLDLLLDRGEPCLALEEVEKTGRTCGISKAETHEILEFFHELGCILYFSETQKLREVVILDPQWLVEALGCVIYDQNIYKKYTRKLPRELRKDHKRFKDFGILSESLLQHKLQNFTPHIEFLKNLMENMLLMSPWIFDEHKQHEPEYLVPSLVSASEHDFSEYNGPFCYLDFPLNYPPHVAFRRLVCLCVEESARYEGSRTPQLNGSTANFSFGVNMEFKMDIVASDSTNRIKVSTRPSRQLFEFVDFLNKAIKDVDIQGDRMKWRILLPYENSSLYIRPIEANPIPHSKQNQILVEYSAALDAWSKGETTMKSLSANRNSGTNSITIKISELKKWLEVYQDGHEAKEAQKEVLPNWHCFLAHEWGAAGLGHPTHKTVNHICNKLRMNSFNTWFDEHNMGANLTESMIKGIDGSKCIIVFITERYGQRLQDMNTNCSKEFRYAIDKKDVNTEIIPVVLDEHMTDQENWEGHLKFHLGPLLFIDMSTPEKIDKNFTSLCSRIDECVGVDNALVASS